MKIGLFLIILCLASVVGIIILIPFLETIAREDNNKQSSTNKTKEDEFVLILDYVKRSGASPGVLRKLKEPIKVSRNSIVHHFSSDQRIPLFSYENCPLSNPFCVITQPFPSRVTNTTVTMCHNRRDDVKTHRYFDSNRLNFIWVSLLADPRLNFIDIGAKSGFYSLIAAALGKEVVAVEPHKTNIEPFCQAVLANNFTDTVRILPVLVSSTEFLSQRSSRKIAKHISSVLLDDVASVVHFKNALLNIDLDGHEPIAFRNAIRFFEKIYFPIVIVEWSWMRNQLRQGSKDPESVLRFFANRRYHVYGQLPGPKLDIARATEWPDNVIWIKKDYLSF